MIYYIFSLSKFLQPLMLWEHILSSQR